jgi:uncharacterized protein
MITNRAQARTSAWASGPAARLRLSTTSSARRTTAVAREPAREHADGAEALRVALRRGLTAALKARDSEAMAVLRVALAAIDNAEAVPAPDIMPTTAGTPIAGATSGAGSSEAARRQLSASDLDAIVREQVTEQEREAERYDALGQAEAAGRLRRQAQVLATYLR